MIFQRASLMFLCKRKVGIMWFPKANVRVRHVTRKIVQQLSCQSMHANGGIFPRYATRNLENFRSREELISLATWVGGRGKTLKVKKKNIFLTAVVSQPIDIVNSKGCPVRCEKLKNPESKRCSENARNAGL